MLNNMDHTGRVNVGIPGFGITVGPCEEDFESNLEPAVKSLVLTLVKLGYKTVGSCQGHTIIDNPYVVVAFANRKDAESFCCYLKRSWFVYCSISETTELDTQIIDGCDTINISANEVNGWYKCNFSSVVFARIELRSELLLYLTNLNAFKSYACLKLAGHLNGVLPHYEHLT